MNKSQLAVACALTFAAWSQLAVAQIVNSTATGGSGGAGGTASGGTATGGAATNSNTVTSGGQGGLGGTGGTSSAAGGSASATGVQTGPINSTGNSQAAEVTVNYITPVSPGGLKGLAAGVDPETGHFVNDNNVRYSGTQKIKNTPDVSIGGPASGPCNGFSGGVGVSVPGFAIGANASTVDPGCTARETARIAAMLGRMDIANAVLENTEVVQEALKAKAVRQAAEMQQQTPVATPAAPAQTFPLPAQSTPNRAAEEARLREQQRLAVEALQRKATMDKVYDNLTFTDAATQGAEKTPQQVMAEETISKQAERAKRAAVQLQLERRVAALNSEPTETRVNALAPVVPSVTLAVAAPVAAPVVTSAAAAPVAGPVAAPAAPPVAVPVTATAPKETPASVPTKTAADDTTARVPDKAPPPAMDTVEAAKLLFNVASVATKATPPTADDKVGDGAPSAPAQPATAPAQSRPVREAVPVQSNERPQLASQPMLRNVKMDKLIDMFGFNGAKPTTEETAPGNARKSTPKTEAAAKPVGAQQQTAQRDPPAAKPADEPTKKKAPTGPADALNIAKAPNSQ